VTICTQRRVQLFGTIVDTEMRLSPAGQMVLRTWDEIPKAYPGVEIDAFVVMPNHVHGIILLQPTIQDLYPTDPSPLGTNSVGAPPCGRPSRQVDASDVAPTVMDEGSGEEVSEDGDAGGHEGRPRGGAPTGGFAATGLSDVDTASGTELAPEDRLSLFGVLEGFKSMTPYRYGVGVKDVGWVRYRGKLWQRDYYERVVRDEVELERFRRYIEINPARWLEDP
jgi:REP element-mobilizing transposase RayT